MELERTNSMTAIGRTAALHIAFWQYDPWYRRAWFVWPQLTVILLLSWIFVKPGAPVSTGDWAKPADCSNPSSPGCAATRQPVYAWDDEVGRPSIANQFTVSVDRSTFPNSSADDQPKLTAALGAYYRYEWTKAVDILKSANTSDPNVQYVTALAQLVPNSTDQARTAQALLREAVAGGNRQAGSVLGRILFAGVAGLPRDEAAGRKLIDDAVAAGEPYAMRLAAAGYVSGEFGGSYDNVKAVDLLRKAADRGEPIAMAQLAFSINTGRGGLARDAAKTTDYLRRSADAGFDGAQMTLARWLRDRYFVHESEDVSEAIKWYERSFRQGQSIFAEGELAVVYRGARAAPWFDTTRSFELLQLCAPYKNAFCQFWLARAYHDGAGTARDYTKAYTYYTVAKELGWKDAGNNLQKLEDFLQPDVKAKGAEQAKNLLVALKPPPRVIRLQMAETQPPAAAAPAAPVPAGTAAGQSEADPSPK
jgi:TPR repeat protein